MADLPETDMDGMRTGEPAGRPEKHRFASGFLLGVTTSLLCAVVFMAGWSIAQRSAVKRAQEAAEAETGAEVLTDTQTLYKLSEIQSIIEQKYYEEVDSDLLSTYLFKGVAVGLDDPYANYYSAEEWQSVRESTKGEYFGIGAILSEDGQTGEITVLEVYEDAPAEKAGLKAGDVLLALNDVSLADCDLTEAITRIKSCEDEFTLQVYRPDTEEELSLPVACGEVTLNYVQSEMLEDQIGYIRLTEFTETAVDQFKEASAALNEEGMEKLIVDLRGNPGGLLDSVCDILDEILPEGLIVYTEDRNGDRKEQRADKDRSITCEVAVLVNGTSASASEIFAGAIQDLGIGPVIGTQTYGKGVVQNTYTLSDGSAFKLTVEKYYTPNGQDIDGNGITPDILVEENEDDTTEDAVLAKAVEVLSQQTSH
jgi:carboxyl-terminal processing protease